MEALPAFVARNLFSHLWFLARHDCDEVSHGAPGPTDSGWRLSLESRQPHFQPMINDTRPAHTFVTLDLQSAGIADTHIGAQEYVKRDEARFYISLYMCRVIYHQLSVNVGGNMRRI